MLSQLLSPQARGEVARLKLKRQAAHQLAPKTQPHQWNPRPSQKTPSGDWRVWLILAGRGYGKTRTGAEWFREKSKQVPILRIIASTFADARDVCVEGESGLRSICDAGELVKWNRSIGEGAFANGATFKIYSGEEPERLRGPQSYADWYDELAAWQYAQRTFDMAMLGLRLGTNPQACITTTPKPLPIIRKLMAAKTTHLTTGSTYENRANLAPAFFDQIVSQYEGTRLGRQEIDAQVLDDIPGALWTRILLDELRVTQTPEFKRIVVAVDPEATSSEGSAETGIIVAALGDDGHGYVLDDVSVRATPHGWASQAIAAYHKHHANFIVYESNQGGEMVAGTLSTVDKNVPLKAVWASQSKVARAEPISAKYEKGLVHHVGAFNKLEDQLCNWLPGSKSPDRLDALVWALTELMLGNAGVPMREAQSDDAQVNRWKVDRRKSGDHEDDDEGFEKSRWQT